MLAELSAEVAANAADSVRKLRRLTGTPVLHGVIICFHSEKLLDKAKEVISVRVTMHMAES